MFEFEFGIFLYDGERSLKNRLVEMMYFGSLVSVKNYVFDQFGDNFKFFRILIVMIVYGMGVNCKGVM